MENWETLKPIDLSADINDEFVYDPGNKTKEARRFGKWSVSINGDMDYDNGRYFIKGKDLGKNDCITHLFTKGWMDWNEFKPAYLQALKNVCIQFFGVKVFN